jgi:hypothetical protein
MMELKALALAPDLWRKPRADRCEPARGSSHTRFVGKFRVLNCSLQTMDRDAPARRLPAERAARSPARALAGSD